jgi:hypothetical protein
MFSIFTPKVSLPNKLAICPLPPRKPCISACRRQQQSSFFTKLPAEIRNEVYKYASTAGAREILSLEAHPLSLLLTCQRMYNEASVLAFGRYVFPLSINPAFQISVFMSNAISHLSSQHVLAITALSHPLRANNFGCQTANVMANAIQLFPNLNYFQMRILRARPPPNNIHSVVFTSALDLREYATQKFVPQWFSTSVIGCAAEGLAYAWQAGERWTVEWPQMKDDKYFHVSEEVDPYGESRLTPSMGSEAVGNVRGVKLCPCMCGNVEWTSATLVQETGRKITVESIYYGPEDRPLPTLDADTKLRLEKGPNTLLLREGAPPLNLLSQPCHTGSVSVQGYAHEPEEDYWEAMRRRNGNWKALCRGGWNSLTRV